jgi:PleD family two-component response regulator
MSRLGAAFHLHALVERMVHEDRDERQIVAAVTAATGPSPRILVAEDEALVRLDLRAMLADAGYDVCAEAADGLEAVKLAAEHEPDAILMDANMPRARRSDRRPPDPGRAKRADRDAERLRVRRARRPRP